MMSAEGELVPLKARIKPSLVGGAVEKWLIQVGIQHAPAMLPGGWISCSCCLRWLELPLLALTQGKPCTRPASPATVSKRFPSGSRVLREAFSIQSKLLSVQVEAGMVESVHETCKLGVAAYAQTAREKWVLEWPGQVVLVVTGIYWTLDVTNALTQGIAGKCMPKLLEMCRSCAHWKASFQ